jgi:DNA-3-methyladenine glycosylase II
MYHFRLRRRRCTRRVYDRGSARMLRPDRHCHTAARKNLHSTMTKPDYWDEAARVLAKRDPVLGALMAAHSGFHLTRRGDPFTTLARAIVGQQISVKAAQSIWLRILTACGSGAQETRLDPSRVARKRAATLRACGLSGRKAEYIRDLAKHFVSTRLDPNTWPALGDEALIEALVDVKGIGRWTAEMFLMFHELRADVLPVDDIGLQKAVAMHYFNGERPTLGELRAFGEKWRPYRSVATWYLWRSLDPIPVEY